MKTSTLRLLPISLLIASATASAGNFAIDARGDAMGGVGVVSGDFLTAPFYNPALTAIYRRNDNVGMLLPSVGINYNDQHNMLDDIDRAASALKNNDLTEAGIVAQDLKDDNASVTIGAAAAFAIPNRYVSMNAYAKLYTESFAEAFVPDRANSLVQLRDTEIKGAALGVAEGGLSIAKYMTILGHHWSFGATPKLQRIYTYSYSASVEDFSFSDIRDDGSAENQFNFDLGALWFYGPLRVGVTGKNMISNDYTTSDGAYTYKMRPQYTLGTGLIADFWQVSVDYDLNEAEKFDAVNDNTQMVRLGAEVDLMRQFKFRGGYYKNLASSEDEGTLTAGLGISPLNITQMDIGVSYTNENAMGVYLNFLSSY
ncbi:conjugal transfer protein TraF [Vibrio agarivorans]|uniref:Conjugal transfer protein TraF n=1 Tax=Vibrio agarivorans TaxID=153622 RepID=A0ABT7Y575_9VIBR|nr:conjugal transfer protein TraF [Vibrio agarivorans]MDN2483204.1 conjugal transfer protein TraF [Vibrio agarivorans]